MKKSCRDFSEVLASSEPVPGGGGVSALVGALAVSLCTMAGNLTTGKKKYAIYEADILRMISEGETLRLRLLELANADAEAFRPLQRAYAIPKEDPARSDVIGKASLEACKPALSMLECLAKTVELLEEMLEKGSVMLVSDVGCGAYLAEAAMESAALNIYVNTKGLDLPEAKLTEQKTDGLLAEYLPRARSVAEEVRKRLHPAL